MRPIRLAAFLLSAAPAALLAQAAPTAFVTTVGNDTFCLEQYARSGSEVSGTWVVFHGPHVYVHDYRITLGADGLPARYAMAYSTPGEPAPPGVDSLAIAYGRDSATYVYFAKDSTETWHIAMRDAFPLLGQSYAGVELAFERLRRLHVDSAGITLHAPSEPNRPVMSLPVRLYADSALLGAAVHARITPDGDILELRAGPRTLRRVAPFDMPGLIRQFVTAFAPRRAAQAAAMAARRAIALPADQLDRFVGSYALGGTTIAIARDGDHLTFRPPQQPATRLLAMSANEFFVRDVDLVVAFESDSAGHVSGLTIRQGDAMQRLARVN